MDAATVESIVVKLTGDGSSYQAMMQAAQKATEQTVKVIEAAGKRIEGVSNAVKGFANSAVAALSLLGARDFLGKAFDMAVSQESVLLKLKAAIEANGQSVDVVLPRFQKFAATMKDVAIIGTDTTFKMLQLAESQGLNSDQAERAVKNAVALAAAKGGEASGFIRQTAMLELGNAQGLQRQIAGLRGIHGEGEKAIYAQQELGKMFKVVEAVTNSTEGVMRRYSLTLREITKQFGQFVVEAVKPVIIWLTNLMKQFTNLDEATKRFAVSIAFGVAGLLAIGPAVATFSKFIVPLLGFFASGFTLAAQAALTLLNPLALVKIAVAAALSPLVWIIGAATVGITAFINATGGLSEAFDAAKAIAVEVFTGIRNAAISAWGIIKDNALPMWEAVQAAALATRDAALLAINAIVDFVTSNKEMFQAIAAGAVIVGAAVLAYKALAVALTILHAQQLLSVAAWLGWNIAVVAATAVSWLWHASMVAAQTVVTAVQIAYGVLTGTITTFSAVISAVTGVVGAFNIVLTLTQVIVNVLAAGIFFVGIMYIGTALAAVGAAAYGAYKALALVGDGLGYIISSDGPVGHITTLFKEWFGILTKVWEGMVSGGKAAEKAWELIGLAARLALSQLYDMWPPLWNYLVTGFNIIWDAASAQFKKSMNEAFVYLNALVQALPGQMMSAITSGIWKALVSLSNAIDELVERSGIGKSGFGSKLSSGIKEQAKVAADAAAGAITPVLERTETIGEEMARRLIEANKEFNRSLTDSDATEGYRNKIKLVIDELNKLIEANKKAAGTPPVVPGVDSGLPPMIANLKKAQEEIHKFDAALYGSAQAAYSTEEYWNKRFTDSGTGGLASGAVTAITAAKAAEKAAANPVASVAIAATNAIPPLDKEVIDALDNLPELLKRPMTAFEKMNDALEDLERKYPNSEKPGFGTERLPMPHSLFDEMNRQLDELERKYPGSSSERLPMPHTRFDEMNRQLEELEAKYPTAEKSSVKLDEVIAWLKKLYEKQTNIPTVGPLF